jgi:hypothetical protein
MTILGNFNALRTLSRPGALLVGEVNARYVPAGLTSPGFDDDCSPSFDNPGTSCGGVVPRPVPPRPPVFDIEDVYSTVQRVAFTASPPGVFLGYAKYDSYFSKLRISCAVASSSTESYSVTQVLMNGVNILPATLTFPPSTPPSFVELDVSSLLINLVDGALLQAVPVYTPGMSPTPLSNVQISLFATPRS